MGVYWVAAGPGRSGLNSTEVIGLDLAHQGLRKTEKHRNITTIHMRWDIGERPRGPGTHPLLNTSGFAKEFESTAASDTLL